MPPELHSDKMIAFAKDSALDRSVARTSLVVKNPTAESPLERQVNAATRMDDLEVRHCLICCLTLELSRVAKQRRLE